MSNVPPQFQPDLPAPPPPAAPGAPAAPAAEPEPHEQSGRDRWPAWLSIAGFATGYGTTIMLGLFVLVIAGAFGASTKDPPPGVNIGLTVAQNVALVGAAYFFAFLSGRPAAADFGLRPAPWGRSVRLLVAVWIGFFVLSAIWAVALSLDEQQTLPDELGANGPLVNALAVIVLVTVIAPIGEELFFRGFFYGVAAQLARADPRRRAHRRRLRAHPRGLGADRLPRAARDLRRRPVPALRADRLAVSGDRAARAEQLDRARRQPGLRRGRSSSR